MSLPVGLRPLTPFDWLQRCETGSEVLATLQLLANGEYPDEVDLGPPYSAQYGPCQRCWIFPRHEGDECIFCASVRQLRQGTAEIVKQSFLVWGFVNRLPRMDQPVMTRQNGVVGYVVLDEKHFLLMIHQVRLKAWLQNLVLNQGLEMAGMLQVFPTMGKAGKIGMGDILARAAHQESLFPHDQLRVRFFSFATQMLVSYQRDRQGILTYHITDFMGLLETAEVFHTLLSPEEREDLRLLLVQDDQTEQPFYWGRFTRHLSQTARDMLDAWQIRQWPLPKVNILYELVEFLDPRARS